MKNCKVFTLFWLLFSLLTSCDDNPKQVQGEYIYRKTGEEYYKPVLPVKKDRLSFAWEGRYQGGRGHITKEFFRCKGNLYNPPQLIKKGDQEILYRDCRGGERHSLPLRDGKEFVYPCLIDLLNYVQEKMNSRIIVTTGHRCPEHNSYADSSNKNLNSKHMIAGEVDFYVEGKESRYEEVIALIQAYYKEKAPFKGNADFENFKRLDKEKISLTTAAWYNKEILIKLYLPSEGRDLDNSHSYPYLGIQVLFDREKEEKVLYNEKIAKNLLRY